MSVAADAIVHLIRWYQRHWSAKRTVPCCKFYPSCSHYAIQAVRRYGAFRGGLLAVLRLLRCLPNNRLSAPMMFEFPGSKFRFQGRKPIAAGMRSE